MGCPFLYGCIFSMGVNYPDFTICDRMLSGIATHIVICSHKSRFFCCSSMTYSCQPTMQVTLTLHIYSLAWIKVNNWHTNMLVYKQVTMCPNPTSSRIGWIWCRLAHKWVDTAGSQWHQWARDTWEANTTGEDEAEENWPWWDCCYLFQLLLL